MAERIICSFSIFVVVAQVITTALLAAAIPSTVPSLQQIQSDTAAVSWEPDDLAA